MKQEKYISDVVDFAHQILDMKNIIDSQDAELEHCKELLAMYRKAQDESMKSTWDGIGIVLNAVLDPKSSINRNANLKAISK